MTRLELQQKLMEFPPDAEMEVCVRYGPDDAADFQITDVTQISGANIATISLGEMICEHG
jgi:uncharacterized protein (DUF1684 family)